MRVGGRLDVAIADDGDVQRRRNRGDFLPSRAARIHLRARPCVKRERACAGVLTAEADGDRVAHLLAPAAPHLDRYGQRRALHDGPNDVLDEAKILQAPRATISPNDLLDRAAEVDVDEVRLEYVGNEACGVTHRVRIGAEDLYTDSALVRPEPELADRRLVLATDALRGQEFRDDDVRSMLPAQSAERRLRYPRHRGEDDWNLVVDGVREAHMGKLTGLWKSCNVKV